MRVLFITQVWPSEGQDNMYSDLVSEFVRAGDEVCVAVLNEKRNQMPAGLTRERGCYILRVKCGNIQKTNKYQKVISSILAGPALFGALREKTPFEKYDVIIWALSTTLITPSLLRIKKHFGAKLYLLLKEYWPQDPCDLGAMKKDGLLYRIFAYIEKMMVTGSDYIGTCSLAGKKYILDRYTFDANNIEVCPNCEKPRIQVPKDVAKEVLQQYGINDNETIFLYGGNMGVSQGIDDMIRCIEAASDIENVTFLLLGNGTEFAKVQAAFLKNKKVVVAQSVPQDEFFKLCCACDVGMMFLFKAYNVPNIPGKFTTYLNAGMPILAAVDLTTDVGKICADAECGVYLHNGDAQAFCYAVQTLKDAPLRRQMKENAKNLFCKNYTAEAACQTIRNHF